MRHPPGRATVVRACCAVMAGALTLSGCATPPQTTRLRGGDLQLMVSEMVASLAGSDFLADRGPDSRRRDLDT